MLFLQGFCKVKDKNSTIDTIDTNNPPSSGIVNPIYSQRNMKIYSITDNELTQIFSNENDIKVFDSILYSCGSIVSTLILTIITEGWVAINSKGIFIVVSIFCIIIAIITFFFSKKKKETKKQIIDNIKKESVN